MRKFLLKILLLFIIIFVCDYLFGLFMSYAVNSIKVGGQGRDNYICNEAKDDLMVFGSSRAVHHYNTTMLEDSLGISCYNCGEDGNGIILNFARLMMAKEIHQPKIIIEDFASGFDLEKNDNHKYLGWLKCRYDREGIADIFDDIDKNERYKMISQLYRYNSKFLQNLVVFFTSISSDTGVKGYRPLNEKFNPLKIRKKIRKDWEVDSLKLKYIERFIDISDGAHLFFVVSPMWYGMDTAKLEPLKSLCFNRGIPLIDYSNNAKYVHNDTFFVDGTHLNSYGADEFTKDLIQDLKKYDLR